MTREEVKSQLPRVGDIRMEKPTTGDAAHTCPPQKCVVVEIIQMVEGL